MSMTSIILIPGAYLALLAVIGAWLFRTSSAPLFAKIIIPASLMILGCWAPFELPAILGWPIETTFAALPDKAELIAFLPYDDEKQVSLWLMPDGAPQPRAYSVEMTDDLKDTLRKAQKAKADGGRTVLAKVAKPAGKKRPHQQYSDIDGGNSPYVLQDGAFSLPPKTDK